MKIIKRLIKNKDVRNGFIFSIICSILFQITGWRVFLLTPFIFAIMLPIFIFVECDTLKEEEKMKSIKEGTRKYQIFYLSLEKFIQECQTGLLHSVVKIDGNIYELEVQLDKANSKQYQNFICYINDIKIKGLNNFLNYKFDKQCCLNNLEKIEFLEYNGQDPRIYFEEKII